MVMESTTSTAAVAERVMQGRAQILSELRKVIVGQDDVIDLVLTALFTGGHCLITGVPGLAKTLLIKTLAEVLHLSFKRIQFTPDLMPADITGTEIIEEANGHRELTFVKGPVFAQIILADEINRTPPKTQAALLEAMQEYHVTAAGRTYPLERPFLVLATQNPIELEGTYPLPEAQLSRFMFNVIMTYLSEDDEVRVVTTTTSDETSSTDRVLAGDDILEFQRLVRQVVVTDEVARYAVRLVDASRPGRPQTPDFVQQWVKWGAGIRASQALVLGGKARALMHGRYHVSVSDIRALAAPTLCHRIVTNFYAESEGVDPETVIAASHRDRRGPRERHVMSATAVSPERAPVPRPGGRGADGLDGAAGPHHRRGVPHRPPSQPLQRVQRRVLGIPAVHAGRRSLNARLEGVRPQRSLLCQEVRGGNEPRVPRAIGRLGVDEL